MVLYRLYRAVVGAIFILLLDYVFNRLIIRSVSKSKWQVRRVLKYVLWSLTAVELGLSSWYRLADPYSLRMGVRQWIVSFMLVVLVPKVLAVLIELINEVQYWIRKWIRYYKIKKARVVNRQANGNQITRSQFLTRASVLAAVGPFSISMFGILHGAYDYRVIRKTIYLPKLPKSFDGIRIAQFSDTHCNENYSRVAVKGGIEMLNDEKADLVFFTGDLVNFRSNEADSFISIFDKVKAPLGVYSVTGNHDYGGYLWWPSKHAEQQNFEDLKKAHKLMGYDLLMNENRVLELGGEKIAIIGVENWGTGRFPKFGDLDKACVGTEDLPVKLLLSHDPTHWDAIVRPQHPEIDIMFAGHTHGFQMGIEIGSFRISPAQLYYKQWADLYQEGNQYLYVNRGFGCLSYLGRIGMPPELTIFELKSGMA